MIRLGLRRMHWWYLGADYCHFPPLLLIGFCHAISVMPSSACLLRNTYPITRHSAYTNRKKKLCEFWYVKYHSCHLATQLMYTWSLTTDRTDTILIWKLELMIGFLSFRLSWLAAIGGNRPRMSIFISTQCLTSTLWGLASFCFSSNN